MKRTLIALVFLLTALPVTCVHAQGPIVATDLAGRTVTLSQPAKRLVAIGPGSLRLLVYLGAQDSVVGIEEMEKRMSREIAERPYAAVLPDAFFEKAIVAGGGPGKMPDLERLIRLSPDLVVATTLTRTQAANLAHRTGIPVAVMSYGELGVLRDEVFRSIEVLGTLLGRKARADELVAFMRNMQTELTRRTASIPQAQRPTAYFGGISLKGAHGITSTEAGYTPARMVGAANLADRTGRTGHITVDLEQILIWNPDAIFFDRGGRSVIDREYDRDRTILRSLAAVKSGRVYALLPYNYYNTNIELAFIDAFAIGKALSPKAFADVSLTKKADEILRAFTGRGATKEELPAFAPLVLPAEGAPRWK